MKYILTIAIILQTVTGYAENIKQINGMILPIGQYLPYSIDGKPSSGWKISEKVIKNAQPIILKYIEVMDKELFNNIDHYKCQYIGIIIKNKKRIYCNFFWDQDYKIDWRINPIIVKDGGNQYFQLEYDVDSKKCIHFAVNGEA